MNDSLASRWRGATVGSVGVLFAIVMIWQLSPTANLHGAARGLLLSVPLLLPVYGLWQGRRYTYRWATFCVLPYFIVGLTEVIANPKTRSWTAALLVFALTWFVSIVAYLRVSAMNGTRDK